MNDWCTHLLYVIWRSWWYLSFFSFTYSYPFKRLSDFLFPLLSHSPFNKLIVYFCYVFVIMESFMKVAAVNHKRAGRTIQLLPENTIQCFQISFWYINKKEYNGQVIVWFTDNWHIAGRRLNFTLLN